jgi:hypothetical protein
LDQQVERLMMATKKQKAKSALKQLGFLLLDEVLRGELAPDLARFFAISKEARNSDMVFKAQLQKGHDEWKSNKSEVAKTE